MQMLKNKVTRRALPAFVSALALGSMVLPAGAQTPSVIVPTQGNATAGAINPVIECAWVLNDSDHNWGSSPSQTYGQDDNLRTPSPAPCALPGPTQSPTGSPATIHIDVNPNAHDQPTLEWIELWMAADYQLGLNNITDVNWHVYHPGPANDGNGTLKVQVHGAREQNCSGPTGMFAATVATGQATSAAVNDANNGMVALCQQNVKGFWFGAFPLSKHQPWGVYKIVGTALTNSGSSATITYYFNVQPTIALDKDFASVNYGQLAPNSDISIAGDLTFSTANRPTLANRGNAGMEIALEFDPMCSTSPNTVCADQPAPNANSKRIDIFDAKFGVHPANLVTRDPIVATLANNTDRVNFGSPAARNQTLCPNDLGKLDLSVHTGTSLFPGGFAGNLAIYASQNIGYVCPTDLGTGAEYIVAVGAPGRNVPTNVTNDGTYDGTTPWTNTHTH